MVTMLAVLNRRRIISYHTSLHIIILLHKTVLV
nr:MAG TPA: hypothetical protein [Bacteriophage sp.]